jgi:hypothetical protein
LTRRREIPRFARNDGKRVNDEKDCHTNPSLDSILPPNFVMGTNWSTVGSAQQYQGSLRYETAGRNDGAMLRNGGRRLVVCTVVAAFQMRSNVWERDSLLFPAALTI